MIQRYLKERKQFGAPLAAFQINQQKLVHMLGNVQAMVLVGWRLCKLYEKEKMTPGQASLAKVWLPIHFCDIFSDKGLCFPAMMHWCCFTSSGMDQFEGKGNCCYWEGVTWWQWNFVWLSSCQGFHSKLFTESSFLHLTKMEPFIKEIHAWCLLNCNH